MDQRPRKLTSQILDQYVHAYPRIVIRVFAVDKQKWILGRCARKHVPDQCLHAHPCSLIRFFAVNKCKWSIGRRPWKYLTNTIPDQHVYVHTHSLIRAFAVEYEPASKHVHLHNLFGVFAIGKKAKGLFSGTCQLFYWICRWPIGYMWTLVNDCHRIFV